MKLTHLAMNRITPERLVEDFCPSDFGYDNDCSKDGDTDVNNPPDCKKCWSKEGKNNNGLTIKKKEDLKELMGSVKLPVDTDICALFDMICDKENNCLSCQLYQDFCLDEEKNWFMDKFELTEQEFNSTDKIVREKIKSNIHKHEEKFW